ncbi:HAMP domain-containing histidine kinase [Chitinophaga pendula]|uniref:sensor histidine kinase n=1 Tax=Chitinophaga TaxID=79328 RepID=UPI000BAFD011|nr:MULTISPECIES: HAMP domain-containing sensor histidine kinase [Chitinophaga]ASZ14988.1 two-component sensor histidine kinase [Chitinophaga sp. MD30]UCJ09784.1 HAMP domain-containing histidine kinase [Chitinophaga pendula]
MSKLLHRSLKRFIIYSGLVLVCSIPVYYITISFLWQYEMDEHNIILTDEALREDRFLIVGAVTLLTVIFFALLMAGFILLNRKISHQLWQPFYKSLGQIRNFHIHHQRTLSFESSDIEEFSELNQSLAKLIAGNITAYDQQKEFADNASHELQTPLSIIQSKLDLLLQSKPLSDEQYHIIEDAHRALARVTRINKNLLLLTNIENSQFMDRETLDFSGLIENSISQFNNFITNKNLLLEDAIQPQVFIEGNKILIEILVNNLLTNAIRHTAENTSIKISLTPHLLSISNPGPVALRQEQIFRRFATASSLSPGTGLGLAIVKQISNRYGWNINYSFSDGLHTFQLLY